MRLLFVNDGSTDSTGEQVSVLRPRAPTHIAVIALSIDIIRTSDVEALLGTPDVPPMPWIASSKEPLRAWRDVPGSKLACVRRSPPGWRWAASELDLRRR